MAPAVNNLGHTVLSKRARQWYWLLALLPGWGLLYTHLSNIADTLVFDIFGLAAGQRLAEALRFFVFEVPKVMMLLVLVIFVVGIIRTYFSPEKTRLALEGKPLWAGNVLASSLGIVTPFCSCSAVPLFLGFVESGIPLGVTFSFLIAAPMINEVAVVLLFGMFGWKTAAIYVTMGWGIAVSSGWIIGKLRLEKWVEPWVYDLQGTNRIEEGPLTMAMRLNRGFEAVKEIVGKVWIYVIIGIAVGAGIHGYVPQEFMASLMGKSAWYSVPLSVLVGIPLYSNAAGIVPIVSALIEKGAALGTSLALMMSVIGLSLPEMIILRKVLKMPLIFTFIGVVASGILLVGYLFNFLF